MAVLDAPPGMSVQQIKEWRSDTAMYDSAFAALYYPWIKVDNPVATNGADSELLVPPSGHVAGLWARVDGERGVPRRLPTKCFAVCLMLRCPSPIRSRASSTRMASTASEPSEPEVSVSGALGR